ncbi:C-type lectin domain family 6 member A-like [Anguilla anguilla]|uniref:C-type lectin domain family 6 member A-like n=1 Tax=Anguilla anguilla TaxID=7936 RepID=UPI0015AB4C21|nr:C-type lectin domain family 6 member A-like [Anguilla anguilla]
MAALVSKDSEGIYTALASPDQDVYSTLGQTSLNSPGAQHKEHSGQSSYPYRRVAVGLGLLCALLLAATVVLCVLYTSLSENYSMLERDLEELRSNYSTMNTEKVQLQSKYNELRNSTFSSSTVPPVHSSVPNPCPQGWAQFSSKCYYFSNEAKTWTDSYSDCVKRGADLVIIESEEEQRFINKQIKNLTWIGLSYSAVRGYWLWVNGTPLQKGFWRSGEPDDENGFYCALFFPLRGTNNAWDAFDCSRKLNFICETNALLP